MPASVAPSLQRAPSPPLGRDDALAAIRSSRFAAQSASLEKALLPVVRIDTRRADAAAIPVGASHFGGDPDLPAGFAWPTAKGVPLGFLAQLRMADIPASARVSLPDRGWLLFFYEMQAGTWGFDPRDRDTFRVVYFDAPEGSLTRTRGPEELPEASRSANWSALSFTPGVSLPDPSDAPFEQLGVDLDAEGAQQAYTDLLDRIHGRGATDAYHHLLGYPQVIQNDMRIEAQGASSGTYMGSADTIDEARFEELRRGASDWQLLLQLDSDESQGWMWGDMGTLFYWIRKQDLAARRFENAWMILQCY